MSEVKDLVRYDISGETIAEMERRYMPLKVSGLDDRKGLSAVHDARMVVRQHRIAVEKKRKELKAESLEFGRLVDAEAKRITALLEPIESHLEEQESIVEREKERIRQAELEAKRAKLAERMAKLAGVEAYAKPDDVESLTDEQFSDSLDSATKAFAERKERETREAEERRIELERIQAEQKALQEQQAKLAAERAEVDRIRREQQEKEERAAAEERRKIEEAERAERANREIAEAEERARIETEKRLAREAEEKRQRDALEAKEAAEREAARPDIEKIAAYLAAVESVAIPVVSQERAELFSTIRKKIASAVDAGRKMLR